MGKFIAITGSTGAGKTALVRALSQAASFAVGLEGHSERPFQALFKQDKRYALANQIDYLLRRAEQERLLRTSPLLGLTDGGLDVDFHGFTRLFLARGYLGTAEFDLCRRFYQHTRQLLPPPELVVHLFADREVIASRLANRNRINIATARDITLLDSFLEEWLATRSPETLLRLDVSNEDETYSKSIPLILKKIKGMREIT